MRDTLLFMPKLMSPEEFDAVLQERAGATARYERAKASLLSLASIAAATQDIVAQSRALIAEVDAVLTRRV
jgi:hypothetical protein